VYFFAVENRRGCEIYEFDFAGKSVGQSTTEAIEANPVDDHKVEVAAPVPDSLSQEKTAGAADVAPSKSTAN
jgi:hypothetical protein